MKTVPEILTDAAETFRQRNAIYKSNYHQHGEALLALFPGKKIPEIKTIGDANRLNMMNIILAKLTRYGHTFAEGGHKDSAHDAAVYSAMLEELTYEEKSDRGEGRQTPIRKAKSPAQASGGGRRELARATAGTGRARRLG